MSAAQKIYIAGPYTAPDPETRQANVDAAVAIAVHLLKRGHFPFIPHLTHYVDEWTKGTEFVLEWEDYIAWDLVWLNECDALFYLSPSRGADLELSEAERLGKPIYRSLVDVPEGEGKALLHHEVPDLLKARL